MSGNTLGRLFCVTNFGESHGPAIGCVIDACPPLLPIAVEDLIHDLSRRKPGTSPYVTQRKEEDVPEILSGVFEGKTTGTPIALLIRNTDQKSKDYGDIADVFRPGHADFTYACKYGIRDYRGGGRSSARLTAPMVAAGAIAKKWLNHMFNTKIQACVSRIGEHSIPFISWEECQNNPFNVANADWVPKLEEYIRTIAKSGDSIGAEIQVQAHNVPIGLGSPLFAKLDGDIAAAMMGLNAVKAVEIGDGNDVITQKGSQHGDQITPEGFVSNHAGGILGGISNGEDIVVKIAFKPTSSILVPRQSINEKGESVMLRTKGRHDPCVALRAPVIVEALLALVLIDHVLLHRAQSTHLHNSFSQVFK